MIGTNIALLLGEMDLNFVARCVECDQVRSHTYDRADLVRKIQSAASIEFVCVHCDTRRAVSWDERSQMQRLLTDVSQLGLYTR